MEEAEARGGGRERGEESVKLFVGQVPRHMTEEELMALFKEVSLVDEVSVIKDKVTKASRGCCFLICPSREEADKAVAAWHNKRTLPGGSSVPLVVKWADTEKERQARRAQKAQSQASSISYANSMQHQSLFGALPMGYIPL